MYPLTAPSSRQTSGNLATDSTTISENSPVHIKPSIDKSRAAKNNSLTHQKAISYLQEALMNSDLSKENEPLLKEASAKIVRLKQQGAGNESTAYQKAVLYKEQCERAFNLTRPLGLPDELRNTIQIVVRYDFNRENAPERLASATIPKNQNTHEEFCKNLCGLISQTRATLKASPKQLSTELPPLNISIPKFYLAPAIPLSTGSAAPSLVPSSQENVNLGADSARTMSKVEQASLPPEQTASSASLPTQSQGLKPPRLKHPPKPVPAPALAPEIAAAPTNTDYQSTTIERLIPDIIHMTLEFIKISRKMKEITRATVVKESYDKSCDFLDQLRLISKDL